MRSNVKQRADENRYLKQEELRTKLDGAKYVKQLDKCAEDIISIIEDIDTKKKNNTEKKRVLEKHELYKKGVKLKAINALVDLNMRRLLKILPDLKSQELHMPDEEGINLFSNFANAVGNFEKVIDNVSSKSKKKSTVKKKKK